MLTIRSIIPALALIGLASPAATSDLAVYISTDRWECALVEIEPAGEDFLCFFGDANGDGEITDDDALPAVYGGVRSTQGADVGGHACRAEFTATAAGAHYLYATAEAWRVCLPADADALVVVIRERAFVGDGFESGDLGQWTRGGG